MGEDIEITWVKIIIDFEIWSLDFTSGVAKESAIETTAQPASTVPK